MADLSKIKSRPKMAAKKLANMGRRGDTELVHVNRAEVAALEAMSGNRSRNRKTGLRQFYGGAAESEGAAADQNSDAGRDVTVGMSDAGYGGGLDFSRIGIQDLIAAAVPGGTAIAAAADKIGKANEAQIAEAFAAGRISAEDMASINAGGRGTIRGGGAFGEDVTVGLGPADSAGDVGNGSGMGGDVLGGGTSPAGTGSEKPAVTEPTKFGTKRARSVTSEGTGNSAADRIRKIIETLGGSQAVTGRPPPAVVDDSGGDGTLQDLSRIVAGQGRRGDSELIFASPQARSALRRMGGSGYRNPGTGLTEFAPPVSGGDPYVAPTASSPPPAPVGSIESNTGSVGKFSSEGPDTSGFDALAKEYGNIQALPTDARSGAYASLVDRRNALLGGYDDAQRRAVASRYYGGAGNLSTSDGTGRNSIDALMNTLSQQDADYYRSLGPSPTDARTPPTTNGGNAPLLPPRLGGAGTESPVPLEQQSWWQRTTSGGGGGLGTTELTPQQRQQQEVAAIQAWLAQQSANTGSVTSPGPATPMTNAGAQSPWTRLTRAPVRSRAFRSRRSPYEEGRSAYI